jgi:hypothetical protein
MFRTQRARAEVHHVPAGIDVVKERRLSCGAPHPSKRNPTFQDVIEALLALDEG